MKPSLRREPIVVVHDSRRSDLNAYGFNYRIEKPFDALELAQFGFNKAVIGEEISPLSF
jgi:hypothetical protein